MLSIDIITGNHRQSEKIQQLIDRSATGQAYFLVLEFALYCALCSVNYNDRTNLPLLAELLKYSQIEPESSDYEGVAGRNSWTPTQEEIRHWRSVALDAGERDFLERGRQRPLSTFTMCAVTESGRWSSRSRK